MKSLTKSLGVFFIMVSLVGLSNTGAYGENTKGKLGVGLRGGLSVYTQNLASGVDGDVGPVVSGIITYGITDFLSLGFNMEWETHNSDDFMSDIHTVSLLPLVELRKDLGSWTPYVFAGAGYNINWVDEDAALKSANITIKPDNTFAFKGGVGADFFFAPSWALNTELGWKLNNGNAKVKMSGTTLGEEDFNASAFSALFGIRHYF